MMELQVQLAAPKKSKQRTKVRGSRVVPQIWNTVATPETDLACGELIAECKRRRLEMLARLGQEPLQSRRRAKLIRAYCRSESARIATLWIVAEARGELWGDNTKWTARRVVEQGRLLALDVAGADPVRVYPAERGNAESRPVFSFGCWDQARHTLAHDAVKATARLPNWMFLYNGGAPAMLDWVRQKLPDAAVVLTTDFPKCFPLLPWQLVETALPLSRRATEALLFQPWNKAKVIGFGMKKKAKPDWGALFTYATEADGSFREKDGVGNCACEIGVGRGIPPGSVLSALAAQLALLSMIKEVKALNATGVEKGLFADNLIIILRDASLEGPVRDGLRKLAETYFDQQLAHVFCRRIRRHNPKRFFTFVGRYLRVKHKTLQVWAPPAHCDRIVDRVLGDLGSIKTFDGLRRPVRRIEGFVRHHNGAPNAVRAALRAALLVGAGAEQLKDSANGQTADELAVGEATQSHEPSVPPT